MKVLHIIAGDIEEGAARGAYWLHQGLVKEQVDSKILIQKEHRRIFDKLVTVITRNKFYKILSFFCMILERLLVRLYTRRNRYILFSPGIFGLNILRQSVVKEADIIHFHWITNAFIDVKLFSKIDKPIVWTFRDMWPITGGCHTTFFGCERYEQKCGKCPVLGSALRLDLSKWVLDRKKKHYKPNIHPVAISSWQAGRIQRSSLFKDKSVPVIHNCVDTDIFYPIEKEEARHLLELPVSGKKIVLLGAMYLLVDKNKGLDMLLEAKERIKDKDIIYLFFGSLGIEDKIQGDNVRSLGFLNDYLSLRIAYSAADVFVMPSIQEAFGKMLIEAMGCGTPAVAFNATGPADIISHKKDGYLAEAFDSSDLAKGIEWIIKNGKEKQLPEKAREKVEKEFSLRVIARKYISLYKNVLNTSM
ncbi:glycosyltransferase family 4 protein [Candidatus Margulisiibacteriota bacterium]